ncbi:MAG: helix-turn-helix domain-containing protein [Halolamina sp.]|uniref:helix-turn-helix domain-containing protein n=1 Tax=Halolamina sp. TaxID=1940283 RepID=UPI002FC388A4
MSAFGQQCADLDIPFTIDRLSPASPPDENVPADLTAPQKQALQVAREEGYFDVPRETTLDELGSELGVPRQAVSFRIRRGIRRLADERLPTEDYHPVK